MAVALAATAASVGLCEGLLRLGGVAPWPTPPPSEAAMYEPDPELGWRHRPGEHHQPPYAPEGTPITTTFLADGSRLTGPPPASPAGTILLVGDSFTVGWAVSDDETYAWRLQARFPHAAVVNRAAAGYGTLQALIVLERTLPRLPRPAIVLYGFLGHHEERNVATADWLEILATQSASGNTHVPYATLGPDDTLIRHPPTGYPDLPLRRRAAFVALLERGWVRLTATGRAAARRPVTERLLLAMRDLTAREGVPFAVVLLTASLEAGEHYVRFLPEHGVDLFDCAIPVGPALRVPGEIHPNGILHAMYAECVATNLAQRNLPWLVADGPPPLVRR
jgi:hypothetical protein